MKARILFHCLGESTQLKVEKQDFLVLLTTGKPLSGKILEDTETL